MKCVALILAAWALWLAPALAAITVTQQGINNSSTNNATITLTGVTCVAGAELVIFATTANTAVASSASDSVGGNTYTAANLSTNASNASINVAYSSLANALSSATITFTFSANSTAKNITAYCVTNVNSKDITGPGSESTSTATSTTVATGTLNNANEVVFGVIDTAGSTSAYSATNLGNNGTAANGNTNAVLYSSWSIVSSTTSLTYNPQWTTAREFAGNVITFYEGVVATKRNGMLLGVGP